MKISHNRTDYNLKIIFDYFGGMNITFILIYKIFYRKTVLQNFLPKIIGQTCFL